MSSPVLITALVEVPVKIKNRKRDCQSLQLKNNTLKRELIDKLKFVDTNWIKESVFSGNFILWHEQTRNISRKKLLFSFKTIFITNVSVAVKFKQFSGISKEIALEEMDFKI